MTQPAPSGHTLSWSVPVYRRAVGLSERSSVSISLTIDELQDVAGMDIVVNYDPNALQLVSVSRGDAVGGLSWRTYEEEGQFRMVLGNSSALGGGSGAVADLVFQRLGGSSRTELIGAKFKASDVNGANLARTRTVEFTGDVMLRWAAGVGPWWGKVE